MLLVAPAGLCAFDHKIGVFHLSQLCCAYGIKVVLAHFTILCMAFLALLPLLLANIPHSLLTEKRKANGVL